MYTEGKDGQKMKKSIVKKVSAICLALTLAFGMTACGGDSKSTESAPAATEAGTTAGAATEAATQAVLTEANITESMEEIRTALLDAEARLTSTSQYGGPYDFDEECDAILDDIRDALAWLDAEAS